MPKNTESEFLQIIHGCRNWDRSSQNALYRIFYPYAMSIAIRYVDDEAEATSVVNEGFLKVFRNIKKYNSELPFKPWFRKILVNTSINHIKRQKKFKMEINIENAQNIEVKEDILSRINYKELMSMIQSLSSSYRTVFNMYVIDGFKHKEIAEILGITVSTSKSNLTRARAKLQEILTKKMNNPYA